MSHDHDSYEAENDSDDYNPQYVEGEGVGSGSRPDKPLRPESPGASDRSRPREEPHQDGAVLHQGGQLDREGREGELFPREPIVGYQFSGPIPPPELVEKYDQLSPGAGQRILDDAHENDILDRYVTKRSFDASVFLEIGGFVAAFIVVLACLALAATSVFVFENNTGGWIFGLAAATPTVLGFLGNGRSSARKDAANGELE